MAGVYVCVFDVGKEIGDLEKSLLGKSTVGEEPVHALLDANAA